MNEQAKTRIRSRRWLGICCGVTFLALLWFNRNVRQGQVLNEELFSAIRRHDAVRVERALAKGADANAIDYSLTKPSGHRYWWRTSAPYQGLDEGDIGPTPLMELVWRVDLQDYDKAARQSLWFDPQPAILRCLLDHGANVNVGYPEDMLWPRAAGVEKVPLLSEAIDVSDTGTVEQLINHGDDTNYPAVSQPDWMRAPIVEAIVHLRLSCVKLLVNNHVNLSTRNPDGKTPLDIARSFVSGTKSGIGARQAEIVKLLSDAQTKPNRPPYGPGS